MDVSKYIIANIAGVDIYKMTSDDSLVFRAGMEIDADGSPRAYHFVSSRGLDSAGGSLDVEFSGIVVSPTGEPIVQGDSDPAPGRIRVVAERKQRWSSTLCLWAPATASHEAEMRSTAKVENYLLTGVESLG
jgi:hypothetical protein